MQLGNPNAHRDAVQSKIARRPPPHSGTSPASPPGDPWSRALLDLVHQAFLNFRNLDLDPLLGGRRFAATPEADATHGGEAEENATHW